MPILCQIFEYFWLGNIIIHIKLYIKNLKKKKKLDNLINIYITQKLQWFENCATTKKGYYIIKYLLKIVSSIYPNKKVWENNRNVLNILGLFSRLWRKLKEIIKNSPTRSKTLKETFYTNIVGSKISDGKVVGKSFRFELPTSVFVQIV